MKGPLHYPSFRRALAARMISGAGSWTQTVAAGWLVYELTQSAAAVGVLTVLSRGPGILLTEVGGQLADRHEGKKLIVWLSAVQALFAALLAIFCWGRGVHGNVFVLYGFVLVIGCAGALLSAAQQTVVTATVPHELAKKATGYSSVAFNIARLVGPALGGILVVWVGSGACFALNAVSYLAVILAIRGVDLPGRRPQQPRRLGEAVRQVRGDVYLRDLMIGAGLFSLVVAPIQELAPSIAAANGKGAHLLGFLLATMALGAIVANRARSWLEDRGAATGHLFGGGLACGAVSLVMLGLTAAVGVDAFGTNYDYPLALLGAFFAGASWDIVYVIGMTGVQLRDSRGEGLMVGLFLTLTIASLTVGALAMGCLFDLVGLGPTMLIGGALIAAVAVRYVVVGIDAGVPAPEAASA
jgi:MFS family permease